MADVTTTTDLAYLPATEALTLFRKRALSPIELLDAIITRADAVEEQVNALTWEFFDRARDEARAAEARYVAGDARPLEGIPVAIKEEMPIAGQPSTYASLVFADHVADSTAPLAGRVLAAGGIVHARTAQPEFACAGFTHSKLFGATRNPWNLAFDVGGSSGGAGAALAAGMTTLAGGSDIGGSIRIPASCCGVVGYKPAYGRVPQDPPFNLDHYCHEGPLTRTVADCALFANVISGPDPRDIVSLRERMIIPEQLGDVRGWKVALSLDLDGWEIDPDVRRNTVAAADALREAGATVEPVAIGWDRRKIIEAASIHFASIFGAWIAGIAAEHRDELTPYALEFAGLTEGMEPGAVMRGYELEGEICGRLGAVLDDYRLLLCPTLAVPALQAGEAAFVDPRATSWGAGALPASDHLMTIPFNIASRCPVISMPSGFSADGVPTGVQVVARTYADIDAFHAAAAIERLGPWANGTRPSVGA